MSITNLSLHEKQVNEVFSTYYQESVCKTDRMFGVLFILQWILGLVFALTLSPLTWSGEYSQINYHIYAAFFFGGILAAYPCYLTFWHTGKTLNRYVVAVAQMFFSILFIHLTGGRIETHFHIFGSLAFLAFYRDPKVLILATALTAADHFFRGMFLPQSVYGVLSASPWRASEHSAWVLFEDVFLFYSMKVKMDLLKSISEKQVNLEESLVNIERRVNERTKDLKESRQLVIEQQQALITSTKMSALGEMAGGIAHEINTPLATVQNIACQIGEILEDEVLDKDLVKGMAATLVKTTDRMARIIRGLRTFSRDESKDPYRTVNAVQLIQETLGFCEERFRSYGIEIKIEKQNEELYFEGRPTELSQVILNLLANCYDAIIDSNEKWVRISIFDKKEEIEIRIMDSGKGVDAETQKRLFQPFFTTKEIGKGTGMGLSISLGLVQSHKGELVLDAQCANTCFVLTLPKKRNVVPAKAA